MSKKGIDVSSHNGTINWGAVKSDGIEFAILRVGYGMYDYQKDKQFENYYAGATSVGIPVGVYLYSYAKSVAEAEREADCAIKWLGGRKLNLPVYFDIEDPSQQKLGRETLNAMCRAFCNKIEKAGYSAGIYASKYWSTSVISGAELGRRYTYWVAQYNNVCTYTGNYAIWQNSSSGRVNGIKGNVDMDVMVQDIINGNPTPQPSPKPQPSGITGDITYQTYDNVKRQWLPQIINDNDYAGNINNPIGGFRAKPKYGTIYMQSHILGGDWLPMIQSNTYTINSNNGSTYSGILGRSLDGIKIWSSQGYVSYRVHIKGGKWLPWVHKADNTANGYAGIYGKVIDGIQMK